MHTNKFVYSCTNQYMYIYTQIQLYKYWQSVMMLSCIEVLVSRQKFSDCFFGAQRFLEDYCIPMTFRLCLLHAEETPRTMVVDLYNLLVIGWIRHVFEPRDVDCQSQYGRLVVHHHI